MHGSDLLMFWRPTDAKSLFVWWLLNRRARVSLPGLAALWRWQGPRLCCSGDWAHPYCCYLIEISLGWWENIIHNRPIQSLRWEYKTRPLHDCPSGYTCATLWHHWTLQFRGPGAQKTEVKSVHHILRALWNPENLPFRYGSRRNHISFFYHWPDHPYLLPRTWTLSTTSAVVDLFTMDFVQRSAFDVADAYDIFWVLNRCLTTIFFVINPNAYICTVVLGCLDESNIEQGSHYPLI